MAKITKTKKSKPGVEKTSPDETFFPGALIITETNKQAPRNK